MSSNIPTVKPRLPFEPICPGQSSAAPHLPSSLKDPRSGETGERKVSIHGRDVYVSGRALVQLKQRFSCVVCIHLLVQPAVTQKCGHTGCGQCMRSCQEVSSSCPVCRTKDALPAHPNYTLIDTVNEILPLLLPDADLKDWEQRNKDATREVTRAQSAQAPRRLYSTLRGRTDRAPAFVAPLAAAPAADDYNVEIDRILAAYSSRPRPAEAPVSPRRTYLVNPLIVARAARRSATLAQSSSAALRPRLPPLFAPLDSRSGTVRVDEPFRQLQEAERLVTDVSVEQLVSEERRPPSADIAAWAAAVVPGPVQSLEGLARLEVLPTLQRAQGVLDHSNGVTDRRGAQLLIVPTAGRTRHDYTVPDSSSTQGASHSIPLADPPTQRTQPIPTMGAFTEIEGLPNPFIAPSSNPEPLRGYARFRDDNDFFGIGVGRRSRPEAVFRTLRNRPLDPASFRTPTRP